MNAVAELLEIENEIKLRKQKNKIKFYNTGDKVHHKQLEFHKCLKKNRWAFGRILYRFGHKKIEKNENLFTDTKLEYSPSPI